MKPTSLRASAPRLFQAVKTRTNAPRRRLQSSTSTAGSTVPPAPQPQSLLHRYRRALLWSTSSLALGATFGILVSHTIAPPPHPAPGTREDAILMHDLETRIDNEFKVKVLRGKCTAAAANLRGEDGAWSELPTDAETAPLLRDSLAGARALGVERLFWNERDKELVAVVWFGGATSGWPGITHGGCIAIVMGEKMELAARLAKSGVRGELLSRGSQPSAAAAAPAEARHVEIAYKKPTYANAFYVIRMLPRDAEEGGSSAADEIEVAGTLETLEGKLCVTISGLVPVSDVKSASSTPAATINKAKSWIGWPSRSDASQV